MISLANVVETQGLIGPRAAALRCNLLAAEHFKICRALRR